MQLDVVSQELPRDFPMLQAAAWAEGHLLLDRLVKEWEDGDLRFYRPEEKLVVARIDGNIVGIGGISLDPLKPPSLRMRRFYVAPEARRHGVAKKIVEAVLTDLPPERTVYVNAGIRTAFPFWEAVGFTKVLEDKVTHSAKVREIAGRPQA